MSKTLRQIHEVVPDADCRVMDLAKVFENGVVVARAVGGAGWAKVPAGSWHEVADCPALNKPRTNWEAPKAMDSPAFVPPLIEDVTPKKPEPVIEKNTEGTTPSKHVKPEPEKASKKRKRGGW